LRWKRVPYSLHCRSCLRFPGPDCHVWDPMKACRLNVVRNSNWRIGSVAGLASQDSRSQPLMWSKRLCGIPLSLCALCRKGGDCASVSAIGVVWIHKTRRKCSHAISPFHTKRNNVGSHHVLFSRLLPLDFSRRPERLRLFA